MPEQAVRALSDWQLLVAMLAGPVAWALLWQFELLPGVLGTWMLVRFVLLQPVVEELVFRGLLQGWLLERLPQRFGLLSLANLLTAIAFSAAHLIYQQPLWAVAVFFPALVFGYFRERYRHVWPAILLHAWYNAGLFLLPVMIVA